MAQDNGLGGGSLFDPTAGQVPSAPTTPAQTNPQQAPTELGGGQLFDPTSAPPSGTTSTPDKPTAGSYFANTSGLSGMVDAGKAIIGKGARDTINNTLSIITGMPIDHLANAVSGKTDDTGSISATVGDTALAAYHNTRDHLKQALTSIKSGKIGDAVAQTGYAIPLAGGLIETLDKAHQQDIAEGNTSGGPNESAAVAGLVTAMLAPDAIVGAKGYIRNRAIPTVASKIEGIQRGNITPAAKAALNQGVDITPGRAASGLPRAAEKFLRADDVHGVPFQEADKVTRAAIESNGRAIADSIIKNPSELSVTDQAARIQSSLQQVRDTAGANVGTVHKQIADLAPDAQLNTQPLTDAAHEALNKLTIAPDSVFAGLEPKDSTTLIKFFQDFVDNKPIQIQTPASKILDITGQPMTPASVVELPRSANFADSNILLKKLNDMVPTSTSTEGGIIKGFAKQLRAEMYNALEPYGLSQQLKDTHTRYATVVRNLEDGIGKQILGSPAHPVSPDLVARNLMKPTSLSQYGVGELKSLLGDRVQPVGRLVWQNILENFTDGNNLASTWDKVPDAVKKGLYTPEQLESLEGFVKDVKDLALPKDPGRVTDPFAGSDGGTPHIATLGSNGFVLRVAKGIAMNMGGAKIAKMLLEPGTNRLLRKALTTSQGARGSSQLTTALIMAAQRSAEKEDREDQNAGK